MSCFLKKKFYQTNPITWNENGNWIVKKIKFFIAEMVLWEYINYYLWLLSSFLWAYSLLPENLDLAGTDLIKFLKNIEFTAAHVLNLFNWSSKKRYILTEPGQIPR